jgi:hypothetical protein
MFQYVTRIVQLSIYISVFLLPKSTSTDKMKHVGYSPTFIDQSKRQTGLNYITTPQTAGGSAVKIWHEAHMHLQGNQSDAL